MFDREDAKVVGTMAIMVIIAFVGLLIIAAAAGLAVNVFRLAGGF